MWAPFQVFLLLFSHESQTSIENQIYLLVRTVQPFLKVCTVRTSHHRLRISFSIVIKCWRMTISVLLVLILLTVSTASADEEGMTYLTKL